ncbi:GNAT domain-containing protein [Ampelomyces quisqualis]|uniref:GNAT domain-containing protein n=1 Tax=Ampelomyces quisqualis TaxID=50730 RepID=A0A6A5QJM4_AMPQU|nr:GNAT domain-containing protein [Ampelomyces quisqualis]
MKINEHEAILTPRVLLVPYSSHHVPTYHEWMQDEEIRHLTASEPLSLPAEHAMQQSWRLDHDKLTFIICHSPPCSLSSITPEQHDSPGTMIGDVNLFLYEADTDDDESEYAAADGVRGARPVVGELELMLPHPSTRRLGFGLHTLQAFIGYITSASTLPRMLEEYRLGCDERSERYLRCLRVKVGKENVASLRLFRKIGFKDVGGGEANYFGEVELRMDVREGECVDLADGDGEGKVVRYGS